MLLHAFVDVKTPTLVMSTDKLARLRLVKTSAKEEGRRNLLVGTGREKQLLNRNFGPSIVATLTLFSDLLGELAEEVPIVGAN